VLKFMDRSSVEARYHEEIYQLATVDPLTDLYNRRQFVELLEKELARAANHRRPLALLIIDIDHFKAINDRYGHPAGDGVLKRVARTVSAHAREEFIIARIGGEEFAAVLPEHTVEQAADFAERLRVAIEEHDMSADGGPKRVTVSIGAAAWHAGMTATSDLLRAADEQLYRAKQEGRNSVRRTGTA
jgi:diguanylate cyclase (GGDEF)-like protein